MREHLQFYIDGAWVDPAENLNTLDVVNPATEAICGKIALGSAADVDQAAKAARRAFSGWSQTSREERLDVMGRIVAEYQKRFGDLAMAVTEEMGAPASLAQRAQVPIGLGHLATAIEVLKTFPFEDVRGPTKIVKEPIGVCGFITPWNWPLNQMMCKVSPAIATGCTMVLKPSEVAPFTGQIFAEIMHAAGVPAGVFNLVQGDGPGVGAAISSHPEIDMVSFTGSTRAGIDEGATLVTGGVGRPDGLDKGYYVKPTVFGNVTRDMTIAKEEIFGPVLSILGYETVDQAIEIGNDSEYGLAAYVQAGDLEKARKVAAKLRAGQVSINGGGGDLMAPFGGYKMSGNGREWGDYGFHEFLETKAILGYAPTPPKA